VTQPETSAISASLPLLVLGLPIIDTLLVFGQRLAERRSPFSADQNHVHHRLLRPGFDHTEAVVAIYLFQGGMLVLAYLLRFESDVVILGTFAAVAASVVGGLHVADRARTRDLPAPRPGGSRVRRLAMRVLTDARVPRTIAAIAALALPVYGLSVLLRVETWPADVALLAGLLAALAVLVSVARRTALHWGDRVVLSVTAVLLAYLGHTATDLPPWAPGLELAAFAAVGVLVFLWMRSSGAGGFETTPLDVLVVFAALVLPNLPGTGAPGIGALVFKAIVLLYAAEVTLASGVRPLGIRAPLIVVLLAVPLGWSLAG
jgi:UDP-GlcNAc:undecaprenyl-phosphate/decaprenyl-phosphate GlcNAc-1-phosphate transferase